MVASTCTCMKTSQKARVPKDLVCTELELVGKANVTMEIILMLPYVVILVKKYLY